VPFGGFFDKIKERLPIKHKADKTQGFFNIPLKTENK
jgi:hypothetical protein